MIASPALWRTDLGALTDLHAHGATPPLLAGTSLTRNSFVGCAPASGESTRGDDGWQRERSACENAGTKTRSLRQVVVAPRRNPTADAVRIGWPLFWRGCEAVEILLTRIFAEQYYKTRAMARAARGKRLSVDPLRRSGERRALPAPPPGRRRSGTSCVLNGPQDCGKVPSRYAAN